MMERTSAGASMQGVLSLVSPVRSSCCNVAHLDMRHGLDAHLVPAVHPCGPHGEAHERVGAVFQPDLVVVSSGFYSSLSHKNMNHLVGTTYKYRFGEDLERMQRLVRRSSWKRGHAAFLEVSHPVSKSATM